MDESSASAPAGGEMSLDDAVRFLRSAWKQGLIGAILVGGITGGVLLSQPRTWESTASLMVSPPAFASELKQVALTIPGYQRLLESAAMVEETKARLMAKGLMNPDETLEIGKQLEVRIFTAKDLVLAPLIECRGRGASAEIAAAIADTWVAVFFERTKALMSGNAAPTLLLIENQYKENRDNLTKLENERLTIFSACKKQYLEAQTTSNNQITAYRNETIAMTAAHQSETDRLIAALRAPKGKLPEPVEAAAGQAERNPEEILVSGLLRTREAEFSALTNTRSNELARLTNTQRQEWDVLKAAEKVRLEQCDRELLPLRELVENLAKSHGQAQIARAQQSSLDIKLAAAAVKPDQPLPRGAGSKALIGTVLGGMLGLLIAVLGRINRRIDQQKI